MKDTLQIMYDVREASLLEIDLTPDEEKRREEIAKDLPDDDFKKRYGDKWMSVKMATATKMMKKEELDLDERMRMPRQLIDTNKEVMIVKKNKVIVIDKKDQDKYMKQGWSLAEEVDLEEGKMKNTTMQANKPRFERKGQELEAYANKFGGVDKKDMMKVAAMLKRGDKSGAVKYAMGLDTDPKEYILNLIGEEVELDEAEYQGRKVKLNSPKRGGPKKFYVYVKNPKTGRVKKISWGDTSGLSVKSGDRDRVRSFVARHKCKQKNDKMKAGYWACRTPRYKALGVKGGAWW